MQLYLGLGSNLGNRLGYLQQAVDGLGQLVTVTAVSPIYQTIPWGKNPNQPLFLNACLLASTSLLPKALLHELKQLEKKMGRKGNEKWGPHEIDIDLLFCGKMVTTIGKRPIPHRQIRKRPFVLVPLADIAPNFVHPEHNMTIAELLAEVDTQGVTRIQEQLTIAPVLQNAL